MPVRRSLAVVPALLLLAAAPAPPPPAEDAAVARARRLLREGILIDGHNDLPWEIRTSRTAPGDVAAYDLRVRTPGHTDLERLRSGGVGGQFWSVYIPGEDQAAGYAKVQLEQIDIARRVIARYPDALGLALTADDVEKEFRRGRIASLLGMEGGHALENSLGALRTYYDLGVRYLTLTHNVTLDWADAANDDARHGGLTRFGEEVVREMNRLGMLVDLSHASPETMDDALRVSEAPVIFSHSSARAVCDVPRNVPDGVLRRLPQNGGVVMVTFVAAFVSPEFARASAPVWAEYEKRTAGVADAAARARIYDELARGFHKPVVTIGQLADHFDHVRKVAGVDHIGIGADYDGNSDWPAGLEDVSRYPYVFAELIRRGWNDDELRKVAGGNVLRAMRAAEATARRLQAARPPSTATLEQMDGGGTR
ncbi:MAG TPA: dipeptidase [Vicinamibacteria bacterium]